jgi:homogentisate 1,2-dioxygenase
MSEFMGLVCGVYDARPDGFLPGGISLHNCMLPHGPDAKVFEDASTQPLAPVKMQGAMAFMFETRYPQRVTRFASTLKTLDTNYSSVWAGLKKNFSTAQPNLAV